MAPKINLGKKKELNLAYNMPKNQIGCACPNDLQPGEEILVLSKNEQGLKFELIYV